MHWIVLNRFGNLVPEWQILRRPDDAEEMESDSVYTPWYDLEPHIHIDEKRVSGIHLRSTVTEARKTLSEIMEFETEILEKFGDADMNLEISEVLLYIEQLKEERLRKELLRQNHLSRH